MRSHVRIGRENIRRERKRETKRKEEKKRERMRMVTYRCHEYELSVPIFAQLSAVRFM